MNPTTTMTPAALADLQEILQLQKQAFRTEAEAHGKYDIEPLRQSYESIVADFGSQGSS